MKKPTFKLNINYEFSKREKVLVYILGMALLIMAALFLVFFPCYRSYEKLNAERTDAVFKQQEMELAINSLPANRKNKENATADLNAKKETFAKRMNNEELDTMLTTLVVDQGFKAQNLAVTFNEIAKVPTFNADGKSGEQTGEQTTTESPDLATTEGTTTTTDSSATTTTDKEITGIYIGTVTMGIKGTIGQFEALVDTVNSRPDIQITGFEVSAANEKTDTTTKTSIDSLQTGNDAVTITFNVYMVDKPVAEPKPQ